MSERLAAAIRNAWVEHEPYADGTACVPLDLVEEEEPELAERLAPREDGSHPHAYHRGLWCQLSYVHAEEVVFNG